MRIFDSPKLPSVLLLVCIALQAALTLTFSLTLRYEFKSSGGDGALFAQLLYHVIHGQGLTTSFPPPYTPQHWFGIHFSPILYALVPLYYLFPHVETLLVVHSAALALAAWPLFLTAAHILKSRWQALVVALLYLTNPFVINAAVWDFHEIAFAPLVLAFILWSMATKNRGWLVFFCIALVTIKTHYGLAVFGTGLLWAWHWREMRFGAALAAFGLLTFALVLFVIMPYYSATGHVVWTHNASALDRFSWLSDALGPDSPIVGIAGDAVLYIVNLVIALWFIPLFELAWWLPGIADLSTNILSTSPMMRSPFSYHSAPLIPVILVALCIAIKNYLGTGKTSITARDALFGAVLLSAFFSYKQLALPFPGLRNPWEFSSPRLSYTPEDSTALQAINAMVPDGVTVCAQNNVLPHLNAQYDAHPFPEELANSRYVIVRLSFPYQNTPDVFGSPYRITGGEYFASVEQLFADPQWGIVFSSNRWVVFEKDTADSPNTRKDAVKALAEGKGEYRKMYDSVAKTN
jgi:uncharacterized membrane protein